MNSERREHILEGGCLCMVRSRLNKFEQNDGQTNIHD